MYIFSISISIFIILLISGCSVNLPTPQERLNTLLTLKDNTSKTTVISTKNFNLYTLNGISSSCKDIRVYIEGDGLSWVSKTQVSTNPTPLNPLGLKLMQQDSSSCKVYMARPCQYTDSKNCTQKYWTNARFNKKVIHSYHEVLNSIKHMYENDTFTLIGYSGGGAIATLTASTRDDIKLLITLAGNLDHKKWTSMLNLSPLNDSLNPVDFTKGLEGVKQYHLIGEYDTIIPKEIYTSYKNNFINKSNLNSKVYNATHTQNWEQIYSNFLRKTIDAK